MHDIPPLMTPPRIKQTTLAANLHLFHVVTCVHGLPSIDFVRKFNFNGGRMSSWVKSHLGKTINGLGFLSRRCVAECGKTSDGR